MADGMIVPQHSFEDAPGTSLCGAEFTNPGGRTVTCMHSRSNDIHLVEVVEALPGKAEQYEVDRHAQKHGITYAEAWRFFEREGYDMSQVIPQYEHETPPAEPEAAPEARPYRENHEWFTVPTDHALAVRLRLLEQEIDGNSARLSTIITPSALQEQTRSVHMSLRLNEIALALEEGRLIIAERTIDHKVAYETWLMDFQIPTTESEHGHD